MDNQHYTSESEQLYTPGGQPRRRRGPIRALFGWFSGLVRFILATGLFFTLMGLLSYWIVVQFVGEEIEAPNVAGMPVAQALRTLNEKDLSMKWDRDQSSELVPEGSIISQFPTPRARIKKGSVIRVVLSGGIAAVPVPDIKGMNRPQARTRLHNAGLEVGNTTYAPTTETKSGTVLQTSPPAGTGVIQGAKVNLLVATSVNRVTQAMPDLKGKTVEEAQAILTPLGLYIEEPRAVAADGVTPGQIHEQDPAPNSPVNETSRITVSYAPLPEPEPVATQESDAPQEPASGETYETTPGALEGASRPATPAPEVTPPPAGDESGAEQEAAQPDIDATSEEAQPAQPPEPTPAPGVKLDDIVDEAPPVDNGEAQ